MPTLQPINNLYSVRVLTTSALSQLGDFLISPWWESISKLYSNPMDYIRSLRYIPSFFSVGATENLTIGGVDTVISSGVVNNSYVSFSLGYKDYHELPIQPGMSEYLKYEPYAKYSLYVPYCGWYEIPANELVDRYVSLVGSLNVITGDVYIEFQSNGVTTRTFTGNCAIDIPITNIDYGPQIANVAASAAGVVASAAAGFAVGGPIGAVAGGVVSGVSSVSRGATPAVQSSGGFSAAVGYAGRQSAYLVIEESSPPMGLSFQKTYFNFNVDVPLTEFIGTGYNEIVNPVFNNDTILSDEYDEIVSLMANGVFL